MAKKIAIIAVVILVAFLAWIYLKPGKTATTQSTAKAGQKISVSNDDPTQHSLTSDDGLFDTGLLSPSQKGSFTAPAKAGTYKFHCQIHTTMAGTLTVQ
jgi:plastocyanin